MPTRRRLDAITGVLAYINVGEGIAESLNLRGSPRLMVSLRGSGGPSAYGGRVDRSLRLAALASAAVPGLDPISVQEVALGSDETFDVAFIQDSQQRRWVIRAPRTEVAAARMDASLAMLGLLVRRVPFAVPAAKGFTPIKDIGRAAVHSYIPGNPLDLAALHPSHPVTAELGRTIAMIHNVDRALYDEAGLPAYDAEAYRKRHLAQIDRGAATGRVPAGLLARWEEALDDVRLWRFAPTPIHGALTGDALLVTFPDPKDADRATIRGVTGWESAQVADPADDFAALVAATRAEVVEAVFTAYKQVRVERPDDHLLARARLVSELELLAGLMRAVSARNEVTTEALTARLRRLDDAVHDERYARGLRIVPAGPVPVRDNDTGELTGVSSAAAKPVAAEPDSEEPSISDAAQSGPTGFERPAGEPDPDITDVVDSVAHDSAHDAQYVDVDTPDDESPSDIGEIAPADADESDGLGGDGPASGESEDVDEIQSPGTQSGT